MTAVLPSSAPHLGSSLRTLRRLAPGVLLCLAVTALAYSVAALETLILGKAWLEPLVLAILIGTGFRTARAVGLRFQSGIDFSGHTLLEIAVVLLGASVSIATLVSTGPMLVVGVGLVVALAIPAGYAIGRLLGLPPCMAMLIACGNAICGNSAIAAVAPVIDAEARDVATAVAFTAVLGVFVVLALPLMADATGFTEIAYGTFAGLTVYAVPQVLAATAPVGAIAVQAGTLVKLVRVLMLGPVCLVLSIMFAKPATDRPRRRVTGLVPWFILGFLLMVTCRAVGMIPDAAVSPLSRLSTFLTVVSMAALGLSVDVRSVATAGTRVVAAVVLSLVALGAISLGLVLILNIG